MSHWNHRTVRHVHPTAPIPEDYPYLTVHEVYYNDDGKVYLWNPNPASPRGQNEQEGRDDADRIGRAFKEPPIVEVDDSTATYPEVGYTTWRWL